MVATLLGLLAMINLGLALGQLPWHLSPADISAGSQPDFYLSTGNSAGLPMLGGIAYAVAAAALLTGSRRGTAVRSRASSTSLLGRLR